MQSKSRSFIFVSCKNTELLPSINPRIIGKGRQFKCKSREIRVTLVFKETEFLDN